MATPPPLNPLSHRNADDAPTVEGSTFKRWLEIIRAEYLEVPGLHLTRKQAQRLWNLDPATCAAALGALIDARFLRCTADGAYVRAGG
jgi:hypothetical protein